MNQSGVVVFDLNLTTVTESDGTDKDVPKVSLRAALQKTGM